MKKATFIFFSIFAIVQICVAQEDNYQESIQGYLDSYVKNHEVVTGADKAFMQFYPVNSKYRVRGKFERTNDSPWFKMETSSGMKRLYRVYGTVSVLINDTLIRLQIYQSQDLMSNEKYRDHLFLPVADLTTGEETYESGRYYDLEIKDIIDNEIEIDFNKLYNPYCAYVAGRYSCPITPKENHVTVAIPAGEKKFTKKH